MKVTAQSVAQGDIVRGIGMLVEFSEPETDFTTALTGSVSTHSDHAEGYEVFDGVKIVLPNNHLVNVRRTDANFRADQVTAAQAAFGRFEAEVHANNGINGEADLVLIGELTAIAGRSRKVAADYDTTRALLSTAANFEAEAFLAAYDEEGSNEGFSLDQEVTIYLP